MDESMKKYIDKSAVMAKIKERINSNNEKAAYYSSGSEHDYLYKVKEAVYKDLLSFINTLEVKGVDLEEKATTEETLKDYAYQVAYDLSNDWLEDNATWDDVETAVKLGAQWQKQQLIDKACSWLEENLPKYWSQINANNTESFIENFRKAMEE